MIYLASRKTNMMPMTIGLSPRYKNSPLIALAIKKVSMSNILESCNNVVNYSITGGVPSLSHL